MQIEGAKRIEQRAKGKRKGHRAKSMRAWGMGQGIKAEAN